MISAYVSSEGIVVHSDSNAILITQSTLDDYARFSPSPGRDERGYTTSYVYSLATLAQSAAGRVKGGGNYIVHKPYINYQVGKQYSAEELNRSPKENMIIKRSQGTLPFLYLAGEWMSGTQIIDLADGMYDVLHVPK